MTEATKNVPTKWDEVLAGHAKEAAAVERPSNENISVRGGHMTLNGQPVPNSELDCIVVASVFENQYYDPTKPFDPDNLQNPICFAQSLTGEDMVPSPASTDKQSDSCATCPHMQWKSDPIRKKGKACKEKRKLGLLPAAQLKDGEEGAIKKSSVAILSLAVTSTKNWSNYVNALLNEHARPPFAMLTTVRSRPHPRYQLEVSFEQKGFVADKYLGDIIARIPSVQEMMLQPYEGTPDDPTKPTANNKQKKY